MKFKKVFTALICSPLFDGLVILSFYTLIFALPRNPIKEFRLLKNGAEQQASVDWIDGLDANKSNSPLMFHPYHYSFTLEGKTFKSSELILVQLKDQPETAKPKFTASITYLKSNPAISQFTSEMSDSLLEFFFRKILLGLLFIAIPYFIVKWIIRLEHRENQKTENTYAVN